MALTVSNVAATHTMVRSINKAFSGMMSSLEKLSSGFSINYAKDGPAQLIISEQFRAQIATLNQQIENTTMLIGKYNTASASLSGLRSQLTEMRSLAIGAANEGGNSPEAQQAYDIQAQSLVETFNNTIADAEYNNQPLFDGSTSSLAYLTDLSGIDLSSAEAAEESIALIDEKIAEIDEAIIDVGSTQKNELESSLRSMEITRENFIAAEATIRSTDFVREYTNFIVEQMKAKANLALLSHFYMTSNSVLSLFGGL